MTPDLGRTSPLALPLYTASVYRVPDLDALDAIYAGTEPGFIYARDAHPNGRQLANDLAKLAAADWGVVTGSGMGAIAATLLACVSAGDRVIASDALYGRTTKILKAEFARFGVSTVFVDTNDLAAVAAAGPAKLVIAETISNPLCRVADIPALADLAHKAGGKLLVDNTFAGPVLCRPLERGADFVMESLTKIIAGHSDVTLGFLGGRDAALFPNIDGLVSTWGLAANPFDCWLTLRGIETLELRTRAATATAGAVADWLAGQPAVSRVIYPGRPDHPDFALAKSALPAGPGHMLCFELPGGRAAVNHFLRTATGVPFCPSLGHTGTTCSHPFTTSHRADAAEIKLARGITEGLIRLSVGIEPATAVAAELAKGF